MRHLSRSLLASLRVLSGAVACCATLCWAQSSPVALTGTVLTPGGPVENATVLFQEGKILAVGREVKLPPKTLTIETHAIIAPGLVDLHNHMSWNVFPRWKPTTEFGARYDWQQKAVYGVLMGAPHRELASRGLVCEAQRYAELKALVQGETATVGSEHGCPVGLTRELDVDPRLGADAPKTLYKVFPFQMTESELQEAESLLQAHPHGSLLVHVAEGAPHDGSAAREWAMFQARGLLKPGVSIIHGVAIPPRGFSQMAAAGVGFIWSPRSNIELYGDTADVAAAKAAGVTLALAPDWSATGSSGSLSELMYASLWNATQTPAPFTPRELVAMATENPAKLVGLEKQIGSLQPGGAADLVVVQPVLPDVYASLTHSPPQAVMLTVVAGRALYGESLWIEKLTGSSGEAATVCGQPRSFAAGSGLQSVSSKLQPVLQQLNRELAPLAECGD